MPDEVITPAAPEAAANPEQMSHDDYRAMREGRTPEPKTKPSAVPAEKAETTTDPESETGDEQETPEHAKKKGGFQKRIDKLTREKADLERQLAEKTPAAKPAETPKPADQASPTGKPEVKNFETYEAFVEALADWKADQRDIARAKAEADKAAAKELKTRAEKWQEQLSGAREKYADFDKVALSDAPISKAVHDAIVNSDYGTELAYFLGNNPAERDRINKLQPVAATLALGRILATIETQSESEEESTPETKTKVSAAPAPIKPVGSRSISSTKRPEEMSHDEYRKARESGKLR